jgi:uncharacterized membrane protein
MWATLKILRSAILGGFWFLPALIGIVSVLFAHFMVALDAGFDWRGPLSAIGIEPMARSAAQNLLTTIAGAMVSVATMVFSLTFVGLTLVSQQLGPRLVTMVMHDRITQSTMGVFLGVFLYAVQVLIAFPAGEDVPAPMLATLMAGPMTVVAFFVVIYFVHHMAQSIQADVVVARSGKRFIAAIADIEVLSPEERHAAQSIETGARVPVNATQSGYVQIIDYDALIEAARSEDMTLTLKVRPGEHVLEGFPVLFASKEPEDPATLCNAIPLGARMSPLQEASYEARALVEIALRALSPGVRDPNTAVIALNFLATGLCDLARRGTVPDTLTDEEGTPRLRRPSLCLDYYLEIVMIPLLPAAEGDPQVTDRLIRLLTTLGDATAHKPHLAAIDGWLGALSKHIEALPDRDAMKSGFAGRIEQARTALARTG